MSAEEEPNLVEVTTAKTISAEIITAKSKSTEVTTAKFELSEEERKKCEDQCKYICGRAVAATILHPLAFARTLVQLGHEPYPLTTGKAYIFFGRQANFLPNMFKYLSNIYHSHGFKTIYTGVSANVLLTVTNSLGSSTVSLYMDHYCPEIGGKVDDLEKKGTEDQELDAYQSFRLKLREAIRQSIAQVAGIIVARPFAVIMVRQIAQFIGNEGKYAPIDPVQPLLRIGDEEGPLGFFSGLLPNVIACLVSVWGTAALGYAVDRAFNHMEKEQDVHDKDTRDMLAHSRKATELVIHFGLNSIRYPFEVVSTVMAVTGSGLLVSMLPYSPLFSHWTDAYHYLKPFELQRGAKMFMREEKGSVRVGPDRRLYASKKHFI